MLFALKQPLINPAKLDILAVQNSFFEKPEVCFLEVKNPDENAKTNNAFVVGAHQTPSKKCPVATIKIAKTLATEKL